MLKKIRDIRNRLTGHPAQAGDREKPQRLSSAIIAYRDVRPDRFDGYIYFGESGEAVTVNVADTLRDNEAQLAIQMRNIEAEMDKQEQDFRAHQAKRPLSNNFESGFGYLLEKLRCNLDDCMRVKQAQTHVEMICEIVKKLQEDLAIRKFNPADAAYHIQRVYVALDFMAEILRKIVHAANDQLIFDIVFDGFEMSIDYLRALMKEIDARLNAPVT